MHKDFWPSLLFKLVVSNSTLYFCTLHYKCITIIMLTHSADHWWIHKSRISWRTQDINKIFEHVSLRPAQSNLCFVSYNLSQSALGAEVFLRCKYARPNDIENNSLTKTLDETQTQEQAGFRTEYSIRTIYIKQTSSPRKPEYDKPWCLTYVAYEKVSGSVENKVILIFFVNGELKSISQDSLRVSMETAQ